MFHLVPGSESKIDKISKPRSKSSKFLDSLIIKPYHLSIISNWIDKIDRRESEVVINESSNNNNSNCNGNGNGNGNGNDNDNNNDGNSKTTIDQENNNKICSQKVLFPEYEIISKPEEINNDNDNNGDNNEIVGEMEKNLLRLSSSSPSKKDPDEIYENSKVKVDKTFLKFQKRIQSFPKQILR